MSRQNAYNSDELYFFFFLIDVTQATVEQDAKSS